MSTPTLINIPELSSPSDTFVTLRRYAATPWVHLSGRPHGWLERKVTRPRLSRYRAAMQAAMASHRAQDSVVISHLPLMSAAVAQALRFGRKSTRHIAFAFNYTALPQGRRRKFQTRAFQSINRFIVFSKYEQKLYADYFGIAREKIKTVLWTQNPPPVVQNIALPFSGNYLCAIGSEGRDFPCLLEAARICGLPLVIVARPHSLMGLAIPANVKVFCNLPLATTWGLAARSCGVIVPLLSPETCCGQITVVSSQMLGLPLVTNNCYALTEYLDQHDLTFETGNSIALAEKMYDLYADAYSGSGLLRARAEAAQNKYDRSLWVDCIEDFLDSCVGDKNHLMSAT